MSDASNEAAGMYDAVNTTHCSECGCGLSKNEQSMDRDVCFDCYCELQD